MKVIQIGCGKMSLFTMRYVLEKGGELVGAFDVNEAVIGKDVAEILDMNASICKVENVANLDARLKEIKPDIAIITTMSLMSDLYDVMMICASNGVNAISTCEEAFYPWNSYEKTAEIDKVAKDYMKIAYAGGGNLYIPATQLDLIQKYNAEKKGK